MGDTVTDHICPGCGYMALYYRADNGLCAACDHGGGWKSEPAEEAP